MKPLIQPISHGIGKISAPFINRLANQKQLANFDEWDQALRLRGYDPQRVELTLGQHTEVRVTAENIRHQANRENVAIEAIDYTRNISARIDPHFENEPVQPEWVDQFWRLAENISSADMQAFWGKVLARKCLGLSNISARALHFISTLSGEEAYALEQMEAGAWQNPELLKALQPKATDVQVKENDKLQIQLPLISSEDLRQIVAQAGLPAE